MLFLDFFSGVGGVRLGMEKAGHECVGFCEFDKFAVASYTSMHLITDEQRAYLATLPLKERQKEILKDEYRNGEWYCSDIRTARADELPQSDCWCFGAPCQDFSVAGTRQGLEGDRSSLIREIFRLLGETPEEKRPEWLLYENVKGMLSSNRGLDFLSILCEMDRWGFDIEWQLLDSRLHGVPQHRERVYTIGHLRNKGSAKIFPLEGTDGEDCLEVKLCSISNPGFNQRNSVHLPEGVSRTLIGSGGDGGFHSGNQPKVALRINQIGHYDRQDRNNPSAYRVYDSDGISPTLNTSGGGGGREVMTKIKVIGTTNPKRHSNEDIHDEDGVMSTITRRDYKSPKKVCIPLGVIHPNGHAGKVCEPQDVVPTLTSEHHSHQPEVVLSCSTDTSESDHPGMYVELEDGVIAYAVWYEKEQCYIVVRKLTPREYFRLQSFSDEMFDRAQFVNSDSQLYKQAGNSVTVSVVYEIARKMECRKGLKEECV